MLISSREVQKLLAGLPRIQDKELVDIGESGAYFKSSSINYHLKVTYYDLGFPQIQVVQSVSRLISQSLRRKKWR